MLIRPEGYENRHLGGRFDDDICSKINGPGDRATSTESVVNDKWDAVTVSSLCQCRDVGDVPTRITDTLAEEGLRFVVNESLHRLNAVSLCELGGDSVSGKHYFELVVGAAVDEGGG